MLSWCINKNNEGFLVIFDFMINRDYNALIFLLKKTTLIKFKLKYVHK